MEEKMLNTLLEFAGIGGLVWFGIWQLAKTLKSQYENRIEALEKASERCEADRVQLNSDIRQVLKAQTDRKEQELEILRDAIKITRGKV